MSLTGGGGRRTASNTRAPTTTAARASNSAACSVRGHCTHHPALRAATIPLRSDFARSLSGLTPKGVGREPLGRRQWTSIGLDRRRAATSGHGDHGHPVSSFRNAVPPVFFLIASRPNEYR